MERVVLVLAVHPRTQRTEVVAEMDVSGRLDAREHTGHGSEASGRPSTAVGGLPSPAVEGSVGSAGHDLRGDHPRLRGPVRPAAAPDPARAGRPLRGVAEHDRRRLPRRDRAAAGDRPRPGHRVPADRRHAGRAQGPAAAARPGRRRPRRRAGPVGGARPAARPAASSARRSRTSPRCSAAWPTTPTAATAAPSVPTSASPTCCPTCSRASSPQRLRNAYLRATTPQAGAARSTCSTSPRCAPAWPTRSPSWSTSCPASAGSSFRRLTDGLVERLEVIVRFLALLELFKQGMVELDQGERFGDIEVEWTAGRERVYAGAAAFDRRLRRLRLNDEPRRAATPAARAAADAGRTRRRHGAGDRGDRHGRRRAGARRAAGPAARAADGDDRAAVRRAGRARTTTPVTGSRSPRSPAATATRPTPTSPRTSSASCSTASGRG